MAQYEELKQSVIMGQRDKVKEIVGALLERGNNPMDIISEGLTRGMLVVGQKMETGDMFIPEVLASAQALGAGMELLKPIITGEELSTLSMGKVVIGTVQGDVHDIGKNIVSMILESAGFVVVNLGVNVPTDKFVEVVQRERPEILGLSALLTTTMPRMADVVEALKRSHSRDKTQVIIGGAAVSQHFADSIGADGYASDAISALNKAKQLLGKL